MAYGLCPTTLNATKDWFTSYLWSTGATTASVNVPYPGGSVWVQTTDIFGYTSRDTVVITYPGTLQFPAASAICLGNSFTANTNLAGAYTFNWSNGASTAAIAITEEGNYRVTVTDNNSCAATSNLFFVDVDSFKTFVSLGNDTSLCAGNTIGLVSGAALVNSYSWNTGATTATIPVAVSDDYSVTVTNTLGCTAADTIAITIVGQAPFVDFVADTVCAGIATNFTNQSTGVAPSVIDTYLWNFSAATSADINPIYTFTAAGTYAVTLTATTNVGCAASLVKNVLVRPNPTANFNLPFDACLGNPYTFTSSSTAPTPDALVSFSWDFGNSNNAAGATVNYTYPDPGPFNVTLSVTSAFGCVNTRVLPITVVGSATLPATASLVNPAQNFVSNNPAVVFDWSPVANATFFTLQIATDATFNNIILNQANIITTSFTANNLPAQTLFWRVLANNICGQFTPSETRSFSILNLNTLGNLVLWLDADNPASILKNASDDISSWINTVNTGIAFSQPTANAQPRWISAVPSINNKPAIRFDGSNDFLTAGDTLDIGTNSRSFFIVVRPNNNQYAFYAKAIASSAANRFALFRDNASFTKLFHDNSVKAINIAPPTNNSFYLFSSIINRTSQTVQLFYNNQLRGTATAITNSSYNFNSNYRFLLGAYNNSADNGIIFPLNGDIAEFIIYDSALPDSSRNLVEQYLRFKYAPPVNLGPDINVAYGLCPTTLNATKDWYTNYLWSTGDTTPTLNIRNAGTYSVTVTDIFGFTSSDTINIFIPQRPSLSGLQYACQDVPKTFDINVGSSYAYEWNGIDITNLFTTDTAGTFFYTIYDTIGCFFSDTITVSVDSFKTYLSLGDDTTLCSGNRIGVVNSGSFPITNYAWSTNQTTATATINQSGNYTLTATNSNGCIGTDVVFVNVLGAAPVVDFTATNFCARDNTQFTDASTVSGSNITAWAWNFGDSTTANTANPTHIYQQPNDYNVTLEVTAASGCKEKTTKIISIYPLPVANFINELSCAGTSTQFNDISTISGLNSITGWIWNFDGSAVATDRNPIYTFPGKGEYNVSLSVISDKGCSNVIVKTVEVYNELIADFTTGTLCFGDSTRFFDNTNSLSVVKYEWDFGNGRTSSLKNPANLYLTTGGYNVQLKVTNAIGCTSEIEDSIIIFDRPNANFTFEGLCFGEPIQFKDITDAQGDSIILQYWNFGDGFPTVPAVEPFYLYDSLATYTVWHKIVTENGCQDTIVKQVTLQLPPVADFSFTPNFGGAPLTANFKNESSPDAVSFLWNFTGSIGDTSTLENPEFIYITNNTYNIQLNVFSSEGCADSIVKTIKVAESILDIALTNVTVTQDLMNDGNYKVVTVAEIANVGTRDVSSFDIQSKISNNITLQESWEGSLPIGTRMNYIFEASYISSLEQNKTFICVEAFNPNGENDDNPANNRNCIALENKIKVLQVYPNPSRDIVNIDIILPKNGTVSLILHDVLGAEIFSYENELSKGYNNLNFTVKGLGKGVYFLETTFEEENNIQKLLVE